MQPNKRRGALGPFDYMVSTMPRISHILQDNFCFFPDKTHLRKQLGSWAHNASSPFTHDGVLFRHYKPIGSDEVTPRRVGRLREVMEKPLIKMLLVGTTAAVYSLEDALALRESLLDSGVRKFNLTVLVLHTAESHGKQLRVRIGSVEDQLLIFDVFCSGEPAGANFQCTSTRAILKDVLR
jgi:hypothetical protein